MNPIFCTIAVVLSLVIMLYIFEALRRVGDELWKINLNLREIAEDSIRRNDRKYSEPIGHAKLAEGEGKR